MAPPFEGRESEHNWQLRDKSVTRVRGMLKGDVHLRFPEAFMEGLKSGYLTHTLKTVRLCASCSALTNVFSACVSSNGCIYECLWTLR
jgi:hypothetical protein